MKKIVALMLVLILSVAAMVACKDKEDDAFTKVAGMYSASQPKKIVASSSQKFGTQELKGEYTLVIGTVDSDAAAVYTAEYDELRDMESGSSLVIEEAIVHRSVRKEYIEGKGVRTTEGGNTGDWDATAASLVPAMGSIALNISSDVASSYTYENNKLTFTVAADKTETVFGAGKGVGAPVQIEIVTDGVFVTGVSISYVLPADAQTGTAETAFNIKVDYFYDLEKIDIE